ncbi:hypothetical protein K1719_032236 [Acacia pycnantha]|nr:hypothetical protein K1719_032236 [Acacia pycnantha]
MISRLRRRTEVEETRSSLRRRETETDLLHQPVMDDQDLGFFANFLGIFIFVLVIAYHYVMADPKYEGN